MSLYNVTIENREYQVNITGNRCTVNGEEVDARVLPLNRNGLHLLRYGKHAIELFLSTQDDETYQLVMFGGRRIVTRITNHMHKHLPAEVEEKRLSLTAPMHGLVVAINVQVGDLVEKDQTLVTLESMKMQMHLRSPRQGRVKRINAQPGSQVEKGALLVQFDD